MAGNRPRLAIDVLADPRAQNQGAGQRDYYGSGLVTDGEGETFMANENRPEIQTGNESELRRGDEP